MSKYAKPKFVKCSDREWERIVAAWLDPEKTAREIADEQGWIETTLKSRMARAGLPSKAEIRAAAPMRTGEKKKKPDPIEVLREQLSDKLDRRVATVPKIEHHLKPPKLRKSTGDEETQVGLFSDAHPGVRTETFNTTVFRKRVRKYTQGLVRIAELHRNAYPLKKLVLFCLGDLVNGEKVGRNVNSEEFECPVDDQILVHFVPAFCEMLVNLLAHYEQIEIHSVPGNHGSPAGKESAHGTNWDVFAMEFVKARMAEFGDRLSFDIERKGFYKVVEVSGHYFLLMHGDNVPFHMTIPYYGMTTRALRLRANVEIKTKLVESILEQVRKGELPRTAAVDRLAQLPFQYLCMGHIHTPSYIEFADVEILSNGTFKSSDRYSLSKLGLTGKPKQVTFGVHPRKGITWDYRLNVA